MSFKPSFLDRAWLAIAPQSGLRRLHARAVASQLMRAYDGASRDRRLGGWIATGNSANAELFGSNERVRNRARDLERNNRVVFSAISQFSGQVVGTGITPRAVDPRKTVRQAANDAWARFVDTCDPEGQLDYYGLQALAARTMFRDGEVFRVWLKDESGVVNGRIVLREPDYLDQTRDILTGADAKENLVVQGVEFDAYGRRAGYWMFPIHPGELGSIAIGGLLRGQSKRMPAEDVDHFYQTLRPGQTRGVSWLAPSIVALRGLDDVAEAMIWRKRIEACIGLMIRSPESQGAAPIVGQQKTDGRGRIEETLAPGKILRFGPGEEASTLDPSTSGDTIDFVRSQLYAFSATTGIPYHAITGDVSQANYSSLRAATLAGNVLLDAVQWLVFAQRERRAWRRVMLRESLLRNEPRLADVRCEFSMPVRPWVDPVKEITAKIMEIRAGLQSMPDALAERGLNWEQQLSEIEAFIKALDQPGIVLDTDPRKINHSGALQTAQAAQGVSDGNSQN
jgi:lambda family phage portal protein